MNRPLLWLRLSVALFLIVALGDLPYSAYSLLRVVTTVAAVEVAWVAHRRKQPSWVLPFVAIAILWNPVREIEFPKATWQVLDLGAAVLFTLSARYVREMSLLPPRSETREKRGMLEPPRYIWMTLGAYGSLLGVSLGLSLLGDREGPLDQPWQNVFIVLFLLLGLAVVASKFIYIRHIIANPKVKYKVVWSLVILVLHFWSELIYYALHIRNAPVKEAPVHVPESAT